MTLTLDVVDLAGGNVPFEGVAVYVWHCNRDGEYSLYSSDIADENYLRGVQVADADGKVTFTSIYPACYDGRWPHVHFEVYPSVDEISDVANCIATSQVALPADACTAVYATSGYEASVTNFAKVGLDTDNVFGDDGGASQTPTYEGDPTTGYTLTLTVGVDTTTEPTAGTMAGMGSDSSGHPAPGAGEPRRRAPRVPPPPEGFPAGSVPGCAREPGACWPGRSCRRSARRWPCGPRTTTRRGSSSSWPGTSPPSCSWPRCCAPGCRSVSRTGCGPRPGCPHRGRGGVPVRRTLTP